MASWMESAVVTPLWAGATAATQIGGPELHRHGPARICRFSPSGFCSGGRAPGSATTCVWLSNLATS